MRDNGPEAVRWRSRHQALMGDVSQFMKLLKQRFSVWFNRNHNRFGALLAERFKSVLVEGKGEAFKTMAAYIDLNFVRAGLVEDPKDYRFCGYAEAVVGHKLARDGLNRVVRGLDAYRELLFGTGTRQKINKSSLSSDDLRRVLNQKRRLPLASVLRCRIRHFSDGVVLGSKAFVQAQLSHHRQISKRRKNSNPQGLPSFAEWGDLTTLRGFRRQSFG